jgi:hypothetical protein
LSPAVGDVPPDRALRDAFELLRRIAAADGKRLVLFLDEFQALAAPRKPYGNPDAATRQLRARRRHSLRLERERPCWPRFAGKSPSRSRCAA